MVWSVDGRRTGRSSNHVTRSPRPENLVVAGYPEDLAVAGYRLKATARYGRSRMVSDRPAERLHDRLGEREALERLLAEVHGGQSRVLVVSGDPEVGKTAL